MPLDGTRMHQRLRGFVETHPEGWNHEEWLALLSSLRDEGVDVRDQVAVGGELERVRLQAELERRSVPGLGPKRIDALVMRFGNLWSLRHASIDDVAETPRVPRALAEKVIEAIH